MFTSVANRDVPKVDEFFTKQLKLTGDEAKVFVQICNDFRVSLEKLRAEAAPIKADAAKYPLNARNDQAQLLQLADTRDGLVMSSAAKLMSALGPAGASKIRNAINSRPTRKVVR